MFTKLIFFYAIVNATRVKNSLGEKLFKKFVNNCLLDAFNMQIFIFIISITKLIHKSVQIMKSIMQTL